MKFIQDISLLIFVLTCVLSFVQTKGSCHLKADIVVVVDESGSVGNGNFELTKKATAKMTNELKNAGPELRLGIAKFATEARVNTPITTNLTKVHDDALAMTYAGQATNTRAGYEKAFEMLQAASRGSDYQKIIVFMTDGVTSAGTPPDDRFSLKFYKAGVIVITVGIADYSKPELLLMSRDPNDLIEVPSFARMESMITDQVFEKACEAEIQRTQTCDGNADSDALNSYFVCDTGYCDWKFNLQSDTCVKVYGSRDVIKPHSGNREWFKQGKRIEFTWGYADCNNKKPFHVSIEPCEEDGSYNATYRFTEITCGIEDLAFDIDFTQVFLKDHEKVVFTKGVFDKKPQCQANHGHKVIYTISKSKTQPLELPDSQYLAECHDEECKFNVDTTGNKVNQEKSAYIWAWFDGHYSKLEHGKAVGPFMMYFCSPSGIVIPHEINSMLEYDLTKTDRITFPKYKFMQESCQRMHGHKIKYQLSSSAQKYEDIPWADRFANCDNGANCTITIRNMTAFNQVNPYKHVYIWAQFDGKLEKEMGRVSNPIELFACNIQQTIDTIDFESVYLTPKQMYVPFERWSFNTTRCQAKHGHLLQYALSQNGTYRSPVNGIDTYASCPNNTCLFNVNDPGIKGQQVYVWAYFDGEITLAKGKSSDPFDIMRCNDKSSNDEQFAHTKNVTVPIDEFEPVTLKFAPSYILDTVESITLKSFRKITGYDTFESIRTLKRTAKKDTSDYYNITVNVMARRKSMDQCKPFQDAQNAANAVLVSSHALGGTLDKGFPYDDGDIENETPKQFKKIPKTPINVGKLNGENVTKQALVALVKDTNAPITQGLPETMFPGFYKSQLTMIGKQDVRIDQQYVKKSSSTGSQSVKPIKK